jgi:hypothetical protein
VRVDGWVRRGYEKGEDTTGWTTNDTDKNNTTRWYDNFEDMTTRSKNVWSRETTINNYSAIWGTYIIYDNNDDRRINWSIMNIILQYCWRWHTTTLDDCRRDSRSYQEDGIDTQIYNIQEEEMEAHMDKL